MGTRFIMAYKFETLQVGNFYHDVTTITAVTKTTKLQKYRSRGRQRQ